MYCTYVHIMYNINIIYNIVVYFSVAVDVVIVVQGNSTYTLDNLNKTFFVNKEITFERKHESVYIYIKPIYISRSINICILSLFITSCEHLPY